MPDQNGYLTPQEIQQLAEAANSNVALGNINAQQGSADQLAGAQPQKQFGFWGNLLEGLGASGKQIFGMYQQKQLAKERAKVLNNLIKVSGGGISAVEGAPQSPLEDLGFPT